MCDSTTARFAFQVAHIFGRCWFIKLLAVFNKASAGLGDFSVIKLSYPDYRIKDLLSDHSGFAL